MAFVLNNKVLPLDTPFTGLDGTRYPANFLRLATQEEKEAIGINEIPETEYYDPRFYVSPAVFIELSTLQETYVKDVKQIAKQLLEQTDWMVIKQMETGKEMPERVKKSRAEIRDQIQTKLKKIRETNTVEELRDYVTSATYKEWPESLANKPELI